MYPGIKPVLTGTSSKPSLSVMLANYNHGHYLHESLTAIVEQDYDEFELLVIDDGSTDGSVAIIEEFVHKFPQIVFLQNSENEGGLKAIQKLMAIAHGQYLYFGAADDRVLPGFFSRTMALLDKFPDVGLCSALATMIEENGNAIGNYLTPVISDKPSYFTPDMAAKKLLQYGPWFMGNSMIYRRASLAAAGGFRSDLGPFADGFVHQVMALRDGVCFIPEPLAVWRRSANGYSAVAYSNRHHSQVITDRAVQYMRGEYIKLFSQRYIKKWQCFSIFRTALVAWQGEWARQRGFIKSSLKIFNRRIWGVNQLLELIIKIFSSVYLLIGILYLLTGIRPPLGWIGHRLKLAWQGVESLHPVNSILNIFKRL